MPNDTITIKQDGVGAKKAGFWITDSLDAPVDVNFYWSDEEFDSGDLSRVPPPGFDSTFAGTGFIKHAVYGFVVPLDSDSEIIHANLILQTHNQSVLLGDEVITVTIKAFDSDDWVEATDGPIDAASAASMWTADTTLAEVTADIRPSMPGGFMFGLADVKDVLQEVIDRAGWVSGNKILFLVHIDSATDDGDFQGTEALDWVDGDVDQQNFAYLDVEYFYNPLPVGYDKHVEQTLSFTETIIAKLYPKKIEDTLTFEEDIIYVHVHVRDASERLRLTEEIRWYFDLTQNVEDILIFLQDITATLSVGLTIEHDLDFDEFIEWNTQNQKNVYDQLDFEEEIDFNRIYVRQPQQTLTISQDVTTHNHYRVVTQTLSLTSFNTHEATSEDIQYVTQDLTFEQDIDFEGLGTRSIIQDLTITQTILAYKEGDVGSTTCERYDLVWKPFADDSVQFPEEPTLVRQGITLSRDADSVTLPAPNFQDREQIQLTRIQRTTRGGDLKCFADAVWPKIRTFRYKFDNLTLEKIEEFHEFLNITLGLLIRLQDHEGRLWDGYIVNPQGEAANFARTCGSTTEFDIDCEEADD